MAPARHQPGSSRAAPRAGAGSGSSARAGVAPRAGPRVLVMMPTWLGDTVMATPALRLLGETVPGAEVHALATAGLDEVLRGSPVVTELHVARSSRFHDRATACLALRRYRFEAALVLPNSFSSALAMRLSGIPIRLGYARDGRGFLLTHHLEPGRRVAPHKGWALVSAVNYYFEAARALAGVLGTMTAVQPGPLELGVTAEQKRRADEALRRAGVGPREASGGGRGEGGGFAVLNPGANNPAKRWPAERFAELAANLTRNFGLSVLLSGAPGEARLVAEVAGRARGMLKGAAGARGADSPRLVELPGMGLGLGVLKAVIARAALLVTNDTGPRHLAAGFGVPRVVLFGPTDPRWTTLPGDPDGMEREAALLAEPELPETEVADDHPDRCRIERIESRRVLEACERMLRVGPAEGERGGSERGARPAAPRRPT
ncbi:MAG: glycosyltransferase family 9 protein [Phycisphaerae bacterium]|nr:glycosyltransferase family 9 protein [Phycisphaerae bacterium]